MLSLQEPRPLEIKGLSIVAQPASGGASLPCHFHTGVAAKTCLS